MLTSNTFELLNKLNHNGNINSSHPFVQSYMKAGLPHV